MTAAPKKTPVHFAEPEDDLSSLILAHTGELVSVAGRGDDRLEFLVSQGKGPGSLLQYLVAEPSAHGIFQTDSIGWQKDVEVWLRGSRGELGIAQIPGAVAGSNTCKSQKFFGAADKPALVQFLEKAFSGQSRRFQESAYVVFDELFTNATIDAPEDFALKFPKKPLREQGAPISELFVATDQERAYIFCLDGYGALCTDGFLSHLSKVYQHTPRTVINLLGKSRRAGIGAFLMFEQASSMYLAVRPGQQSLVGFAIPLKFTNRNKESFRKNVSVIKFWESKGSTSWVNSRSPRIKKAKNSV